MQQKSQRLQVNSASSLMLAISTAAIASVSHPVLAQESTQFDSNALSQVTSVSQLSDVQPTDWAFQALQSLVERYGCIAGYPDGTYRGNRALTRYEFAAGLNACLDRVNELIATASANQVTREDLATLQRLQEEFAAEVATLRGRTDALEATVAELEANQFSTTTQLTGEVVVGAAGIISGQDTDGNDLDDSTILGHRTRLEFNTSFTGNDQLYTLISTGNFPGFSSVTGITEGELSFTQDEANDIGLESLLYSFPVGERTEVVLGFTGSAFYDYTDTLNVLDGDGGSGALSAFGTRNPIYNLGDGAGLGIRQQLGNSLELSLGYLATDASSPLDGGGLSNGPYAGIAQLVLRPSDRFNIGLTYINSYKASDTGAGSSRASFARFDDAFFENLNLDPVEVPTASNSYGVQLSWQISNNFVLGGWAGYTNTRLLSTLGGLLERGDSDIFNYAVTLAFPDLGREGNLLGIVVGMEPRLTSTGVTLNPAAAAELVAANPNVVLPDLGEDEDMSLHVEAFYQLQLTDNFAITPGVIWITAPDFNNANQDIVIGAIRTTFSF
ncbi:carbohydrate porin [Gloeocapsopsis crepidinum LEGE 06123]|uniref:Carbohydrate porin n=1 Tax=Gloeocapsopsis crepidinum LEGE 06123 TaxID=588587 RepID=A0ABR9UMB0_9CHRO|nr:iron uptake porin [Gloeocapsopsis crepidinum]MBE9189406.1 carbohydrate porin [Gloeocapsopsis crepidinum LEGE 06123]